MGTAKTYAGGCHCGKVRYEVTTDLGYVMDCNCSFCQRRGGLLWFVPRSALRLRTPEGDLSPYKFNKHVIHHTFCSTRHLVLRLRKKPDGTRDVFDQRAVSRRRGYRSA
jgi:hypothetical protein